MDFAVSILLSAPIRFIRGIRVLFFIYDFLFVQLLKIEKLRGSL